MIFICKPTYTEDHFVRNEHSSIKYIKKKKILFHCNRCVFLRLQKPTLTSISFKKMSSFFLQSAFVEEKSLCIFTFLLNTFPMPIINIPRQLHPCLIYANLPTFPNIGKFTKFILFFIVDGRTGYGNPRERKQQCT